MDSLWRKPRRLWGILPLEGNQHRGAPPAWSRGELEYEARGYSSSPEPNPHSPSTFRDCGPILPSLSAYGSDDVLASLVGRGPLSVILDDVDGPLELCPSVRVPSPPFPLVYYARSWKFFSLAGPYGSAYPFE